MDNLLPLITAIAGLGAGYGVLKATNGTHSRSIKELWEKKADAETVRKLETQVNGIDSWGRSHDEKANDMRTQFSERFARIERSLEIYAEGKQEMIRIIEKMEKKLEDRLDRVEHAIERRNGNTQ